MISKSSGVSLRDRSYSEAVSQRCSLKKVFLAKFTGKHLCQSLFFKNGAWYSCFPVNFMKFLRTSFLKEHLWWLRLFIIKVC